MVRWFLVLGAVLALPAATAAAAPLGALQTVRLSAELFAEGIARDDAVLMLAAARLRKPVEITLSDRTPGAVMASVHVPLGWQEMADQAAALAEDDDALLGLIDDLRAETAKGKTSGPFYNIAALLPGESHDYPAETFRGGTLAEAYVEAAGGADLNIVVTDAAGNEVCADRDPSPIAYCAWTPAADGAYGLRVENRGPADATYSLMTN